MEGAEIEDTVTIVATVFLYWARVREIARLKWREAHFERVEPLLSRSSF